MSLGRMQNIDTMESNYSVLDRNGVLIYGTIWRNFENFILNETNQSQK